MVSKKVSTISVVPYYSAWTIPITKHGRVCRLTLLNAALHTELLDDAAVFLSIERCAARVCVYVCVYVCC